MQIRDNPEEHDELNGLLELPQGRIRKKESILECAERELREETGMKNFKPITKMKKLNYKKESLESAVAAFVSDIGLKSYLAVCLVGTAQGTPQASDESKSPSWYRREEVEKFIDEGKIFPLNVPMLLNYYEHK